MNETPRRPWWRLHAVTSFQAITFIIATAVVNLHGRQTEKEFGGAWEWSHGWPFTFLRREIWLSSPSPRLAMPEFTSLWLDGKATSGFTLIALIADLVIAAALVIGAVLVVERRRQRQQASLRFNLKSLLALTAAVASCLWLRQNIQDAGADWREDVYGAAKVVLYVGIGLAWLAFFDLLGGAWNRFTARREATEAHRSASAPTLSKPL